MSLTWAFEKLGNGKEFEDMVIQALETDPGSDGLIFIPYLAGERNPYWKDNLRGGFFGLRVSCHL